MKKIKLLGLLILFAFTTYGQKVKICAYREYLTEERLRTACHNFGYQSEVEAEKEVDNILNNIGLYRNFIIKECPGISNAIAATVQSSLGTFERYIIYDPEFFKKVKNATGTNWSAVSILAHEIGHHLNGHNLVAGINSHEAELQADEFSGFVLAKMGASLSETVMAINTFSSNEYSSTHPKKDDRIKAITKGWNRSNNSGFDIENPNNISLYPYNLSESNRYINLAYQDGLNKNYKAAGNKAVIAFQYSAGLNKDYLFYAASYFLNAQDYDNAVKYYINLIKNGISSLDKVKQQEVYLNTALIYNLQGKTEQALNFFVVARRENPNDYNLAIGEANIYLQQKDYNRYASIVNEIIMRNPTNADLIFNLGVISFESGNVEEAIKNYKKVIQIDKNYKNAYLNISIAILADEKRIINEMNRLGNSTAEDKKYNELNQERKNIFKESLIYLEKYVSLDPYNKEVNKTLQNIKNTLKN